MTDKLTIQGSIDLGPTEVSDTTFPASSDSFPLTLNPSARDASVSSQGKPTCVSGFTTLGSLGAGKDVQKGTFAYVRVQQDASLRITTDDGNGGSIIAVISLAGLFVAEFTRSQFLKKLEIDTSGKVEYLITGEQ